MWCWCNGSGETYITWRYSYLFIPPLFGREKTSKPLPVGWWSCGVCEVLAVCAGYCTACGHTIACIEFSGKPIEFPNCGLARKCLCLVTCWRHTSGAVSSPNHATLTYFIWFSAFFSLIVLVLCILLPNCFVHSFHQIQGCDIESKQQPWPNTKENPVTARATPIPFGFPITSNT